MEENSMDINEAFYEFKKLSREIEHLLDKLGYECENMAYDFDNLDEKFYRSQFRLLAEKLSEVNTHINYLSRPVFAEGILTKNPRDRYEVSGVELSSGTSCEILYSDGEYEQSWIYTTIEHNGYDYYATKLGRDKSIDGMMARIRR